MNGLSAVVTGGSRGLGLLLADELLHRGCEVTIAARDAAEVERAAGLLRRRGRTGVRTAVCDVRERGAVHDLFGDVRAASGSVDIVVANAGIIQVAPLEAIRAEDFEDAMSTIFMGALHTSLEALPHLRESAAGGRLALIGSVGGLLAAPHLLPYSCAKSAVSTLAEGLHAEAARGGVSVTAVHPGLMRTGSHLHAQFGGDRQKEFAWFSAIAGTPLVSMDGRRAAARIVGALQRRRTRIVLTPAARAADLAHGIAPALITQLSTVAARLLPSTDSTPDMQPGVDVPTPTSSIAAKLRKWGSALNDRAAAAYNERRRTDQEHKQRQRRRD
ncbi:SDR family NAD(P)-dependent oxidoreductase [Streptomyces sp. NPDC058142]|uniref:SDR family NAD(P)-dependent oxidoreductase n=1 Tax=Streptomyces sp. NPDC058142 TaxID=3346355 RepID=UPI0036EA8523